MTSPGRSWRGPGVLLVLGALILGARAAAGLLGLDEALVVLSGMRPAGWSDVEAGLACAVFVLTHLAAVLLAPVLLLAAAIDATISAIGRRRARGSAGSSGPRAG